MKNKLYVGILAAVIFVVGAGYIIYSGRPVMNIQPAPSTTETQAPASTTTQAVTTTTATEVATSTPSTGAKSFSMGDVQAHNTESNCWAAISGNVYDLTSWVSRHPGGSRAITSLCGIDGTERFTKKHGIAKNPAAALILLKIGTLK